MDQDVMPEAKISSSPQRSEYDFIDFSFGNTWLDTAPQPHQPPPCLEALRLISLCASGDVHSQKTLLGFTEGGPHKSAVQTTQLPNFDMLEAAVANKQAVILELLLLRYPLWRIYCPRYLDLAYVNPHYQTFSLLHVCAPNIVNMEFDRERSTTLIESCRSGEPTIPHYLIDCGADVNGGTFSNYGPLYAAVTYKQPLSLIQKLIEKGATVNRSAILAAILRQELPILRLVLAHGFSSDWRCGMQEAYATKNEEVVSLVEERAIKLKPSEKKMLATQLSSQKGKQKLRWWRRHQ